MTESNNIYPVQGTAALKIRKRTPRNLVRLEQQNFCRRTYRIQSQPQAMTYRDYVAQEARNAAHRFTCGSLAGTYANRFSSAEAAFLSIGLILIAVIALIAA